MASAMHLLMACTSYTLHMLPPLTNPWRTEPLRALIVEPTEACAQAQREEYFKLIPSQKLPTSSLDLRAWAPKDQDCFEAQVMARQEGTRVPNWKNCGVVAAMDEASLSMAVAKQRALIERWAWESLNDVETNELLLRIDGPTPIELAWCIRPPKPSLLDGLMGKKAEAPVYNVVPPGLEFDEAVRCGFLGKLAREYRGGGVSLRADRIVIGQPPEVPARVASQVETFGDSKYVKGGGSVSLTGGWRPPPSDGRKVE